MKPLNCQRKKKKAFDFVGRMLENIVNSADDPNLISNGQHLIEHFYHFYVYLKLEDQK